MSSDDSKTIDDRDRRDDRPDEAAPEDEAVPEIDEGRYLYCLVRVDEDETIETTGVDDEPVSLLAVDDVGAVVHECETIYDSADLAEVKRWLIRHQTVVDEAGEAFGTPIPFQFDTILRGGDERLREWLREEYETIDRALSGLADHWEYRIEVVETDPIDDETLLDRDDRLRELDERIAASEEGAAFLLEKRYEQRVRELRQARRESLSDDLRARLDDVAREVHALERSPSATLGDGSAGGAPATDGETLCRLTLLAHEDEEGAVGSVLDDVAENPGLEVRFTGPWPPYTFAPEFGDGEETTQP